MYFTSIIPSFICQSEERIFRSSLWALGGIPGGKAHDSILLPWLHAASGVSLVSPPPPSPKKKVCSRPWGIQILIKQNKAKIICGFAGPNLGYYKDFTCQASHGKADFPAPGLVHSLWRKLQSKTPALLANHRLTRLYSSPKPLHLKTFLSGPSSDTSAQTSSLGGRVPLRHISIQYFSFHF